MMFGRDYNRWPWGFAVPRDAEPAPPRASVPVRPPAPPLDRYPRREPPPAQQRPFRSSPFGEPMGYVRRPVPDPLEDETAGPFGPPARRPAVAAPAPKESGKPAPESARTERDPSEKVVFDEPSPDESSSGKPSSDKEALQRALRDLEATEARVKRNAERVYDEARSKLVFDLLPVLDNLDRTLEATEGSSDASLIEGVRMVRNQLEGVLIRYGVERIEASGQPFDPKEHEAVSTMEVKDPAQKGMVVRQATPGYRFNGRVLRAAKVAVGAFTPPPARGLEIDDSFFEPSKDRFS